MDSLFNKDIHAEDIAYTRLRDKPRFARRKDFVENLWR